MKESKEILYERALKFVVDTFAVYSDRSGLEDKWRRWDKLYNCISEKKTYNGTADLFPPKSRRAVRALLNFLDECLFSQSPNFKIKGVGGNNDNKKAEINAQIIQLQQEKIRFRNKVRQFLEKTIIYGTGIAKVPWITKEKYVIKQHKQRVSVMNFLKNIVSAPLPKVNKEVIPIYDNIDFIPLDLRNVYWNPYEKWDNQQAIIEISHNVTNSQLRLLEANQDSGYFGISEYLELYPRGIEQIDKTDERPETANIVGITDRLKVHKDRHELMECWCNFDIDNDGIDEECVITVLDRKKVVRCELNPYDIQEKPYLLYKWEDIDEAESLGVGVIQLAEKSQIALNDFTNQFMDDITMVLDCMMLVDTQAGIPSSQLKSRPHGIIQSSTGVDAIKFIRPPDITNAALRGIQMTAGDIMEVTGATANLQGMPARYDTTATEANTINNSSQRDLFTKLRTFEDEVLKQFLRKAYSYNLQFMSSNDVKKIIGQKAFSAYLTDSNTRIDYGYDLSDILLGDFDFVPLSVTQMENKVIKGQQMMNLYNIAIKSPAGIWNIKQIAKRIAEILNDGDLSIVEPEISSELASPQDENILMSQGEKPFAKMQENHAMHIQVHESAQLPIEAQKIRIKHIEEHLRLLQQQQQQQQMMMQQELMKQMIGQAMVNNAKQQAEQELGVPIQEQPAIAPKGITENQAGQVPGMVNVPPAVN